MNKKCNSNPGFDLVFQLCMFLEVSLKLGRLSVSDKISNFSISFDFDICPGNQCFTYAISLNVSVTRKLFSTCISHTQSASFG